MPDALGWAGKLTVLIPSTNTIVQPEMDGMRPPGVTNHVARIAVPNAPLRTDADMEAFMRLVDDGLRAALDSALTCEPDHVVVGMSSETFWGGLEGSRALQARLESWTDLPITMGSAAADAALKALGARRIGVLTPYQPVGDAHVRRYFTELGYDVGEIVGLRCGSPTLIAEVERARIDAALDHLAATGVDAIVQCGTNLCVAHLVQDAERRGGRPVVAINTALYWHALRTRGIPHRPAGYGRLFREH